jgi:16S rRNA (uracil1498-N3)-methyltransferase
MNLFYTVNVSEDTLTLRDEEHIHCIKALRHNVGDQISITDGKGSVYHSLIEKISKAETLCKVLNVTKTEPIMPVTSIAIAPTKNAARIEWLTEKAVEIGISEIVLFRSARSERKIFNTDRIKKIAIAAMKQSQQAWLPEIISFDSFEKMLNHTNIHSAKFIAHFDGPAMVLTDRLQIGESTVVLIGPEGDFTPDEVKNAIDAGYFPVSLGQNRLRTETAGLVALVMMRFHQ